MMLEHDELLPVFIEESQQHLQTIEPELLALERSGDKIDPDVINKIFRSIHSIKGASGFFGLQNISKLSHVMENTLALLRDDRIAPSSKLIDALLSGADALRAMIEDVGSSEGFNISHHISYLQKIIDDASVSHQTVTVAGKTKNGEEVCKFDISESEIRYFISKGLHLYAVKIYLKEDLRKRDRTPYSFIRDMETHGMYVDSFLDILSITGLSDCLENDLAFDFLFATSLDVDGVARGLKIPKERITPIDLETITLTSPKPVPTTQIIEPAPAIPQPELPVPPDRIPQQQQQESEPQPSSDERPEDEPIEELPVTYEDKHFRQIQTHEKIRVGVNFLNDLVNLAGELVLGRNQLMQFGLALTKIAPGLNPVLQQINRITSELQEKIMQMRMQPISLIFTKFHRMVRTLARNHNKEVKLLTYGEEVELDKTIIEGLSDPLTHLIRNAVDHGVELPDEREKAGKPRHGTLLIRAYHQAGQVHIEISDDGRGIDANRVGQKAVEKGFITHEQRHSMTEKELIRLIFLPGFSTADKVTDLSGRGVGMDVVMTNIEHLGGSVDIETKPGKGTKITLILPLTLAIVSGLMVKADSQYFILPEADIDELVRIKPDEIQHRINSIQGSYVLRLRDMLLPLIHLNKVLGISSNDDKPEALSGNPTPVRILVIKYGMSRFGLIVDSIESTEEIVVKPLPRYLKKMKVFSGVSILGNGQVSLILDAAGIIKKAGLRHLDAVKNEVKEFGTRSEGEQESQTFLIFDNGTEERFAFPLELISRIEQIPVTRIERIKDKRFLQYHEKKLRLMALEDYLPVSHPDRTKMESAGVMVPKLMKYPMGILFNRVINTIRSSAELDTTSIMAPGLFGTLVLDGKITLLPDMYRLFELAAPEFYKTEEKTCQDPERQLKVLLVDDTPFFRMIENEYLTSAGYEVLTAQDGKEALQILENEAVDAVVLDIMMPRMDGWETIQAIRADERLKHLPVMAVTSVGDEVSIQKGKEAGFNEWEIKLDKVRLLQKLANMITC